MRPAAFFVGRLRPPLAVVHRFLFQTKRDVFLPHSKGFPRAYGPMVRDAAASRKELKLCHKQHPLPIRLQSKSADVR